MTKHPYIGFKDSHSSHSPRPGAEEVHGGGEGGLKSPRAAGSTKGGAGYPRVSGASSQVVMCMERPGQTGKTPLCHHPQLYRQKSTHTEK